MSHPASIVMEPPVNQDEEIKSLLFQEKRYRELNNLINTIQKNKNYLCPDMLIEREKYSSEYRIVYQQCLQSHYTNNI
jgi:hypothetical protein